MFDKNKCGEVCPPTCVEEAPINNCVQNDFYHEVKHIVPIHTHVIDRHIYNHTYVPKYTCSKENQVVNNDPGSCMKW